MSSLCCSPVPAGLGLALEFQGIELASSPHESKLTLEVIYLSAAQPEG